jgi:predicted HAD superfamily phosphohydrolase
MTILALFDEGTNDILYYLEVPEEHREEAVKIVRGFRHIAEENNLEYSLDSLLFYLKEQGIPFEEKNTDIREITF